MEGNHPLYFGNQCAGRVTVTREGLYYRFRCRCSLSGDVVSRIFVTCGDKTESLGIPVPEGKEFCLDTRISAKRVGEGEPSFFIRPDRAQTDGQFVPIRPEEPFAYISRLKDSYLAFRDGQPGVVIKPKP